MRRTAGAALLDCHEHEHQWIALSYIAPAPYAHGIVADRNTEVGVRQFNHAMRSRQLSPCWRHCFFRATEAARRTNPPAQRFELGRKAVLLAKENFQVALGPFQEAAIMTRSRIIPRVI